MGGDFTSKDFRTWGGTRTAALAFADTPLLRRRVDGVLAATQNDVIHRDAGVLGNTPAAWRRPCIHPAFCDALRQCPQLRTLRAAGAAFGAPDGRVGFCCRCVSTAYSARVARAAPRFPIHPAPPRPGGRMSSAKMNIWLHRTVLARIAANRGNVPPDLLG